jgi:hypothetical protein
MKTHDVRQLVSAGNQTHHLPSPGNLFPVTYSSEQFSARHSTREAAIQIRPAKVPVLDIRFVSWRLDAQTGDGTAGTPNPYHSHFRLHPVHASRTVRLVQIQISATREV